MRVVKANEDAFDEAGLAAAAATLVAGGLVAFPTETVYGLGADAGNAAAVARVFAAKGRPADNPVIVHVADAVAARLLSPAFDERAERLAAAFWPGPLTLVLPRGDGVADAVTAGLDTVALRVPAHTVALRLLREAGVPVAAPSANRSTGPSPTTAEHVIADLASDVDVVVDGGPCSVGVESTVVSLVEPEARVLRFGGVAVVDLERVLGAPVLVGDTEAQPRSPGVKYRHYQPRAEVVLALDAAAAGREAATLVASGLRVGVVGPVEVAGAALIARTASAPQLAVALYAAFRDADARGLDVLVVAGVPEDGVGAAVMDRARRAARRTVG